MNCKSILPIALLLASAACSREPAEQDAAAGNSGAMVNRADDAPGNAATAPVPVSGSGEVPPNAPISQAGVNQTGAGQADNGSATP